MWIAKPSFRLTQKEVIQWQEIEANLPLSQRMCWAKAIETVSGKTFLVFDPIEKVGGMVFSPSPGKYECINGPHLDWDDPARLPRQLATFAHAVTRLQNGFSELHLAPRWIAQEAAKRLTHTPIEPSEVSKAATLVIDVRNNAADQLRGFSSRLQRTLNRNLKIPYQVETIPCSKENTEGFVCEMVPFARNKGFSVPPLEWFQSLTGSTFNSSNFWLTRVWLEQFRCEILFSLEGKKASYLFGFEKREPQADGSVGSELGNRLSLSSLAQWETLLFCSSQGIEKYDLNGYVVHAPQSHPYAGVNEFKKQFNGNIIEYWVPHFRIA